MASGRETSTDCLFTSSSLRAVRVANKRESQRLATRLQSLNNEMQLNMTHINYRLKKTNEKLVRMRKEIGEKIEQEPEETIPSKDQDDYNNAHADYLLREENDPVSSIKQLITYAMEQFELRREESQTLAAQDDLDHVSTKDEQLHESVEPEFVPHTEEIDQTQASGVNDVTRADNTPADPEIMTVEDLKALIVNMYGPEEKEFNLDSVTECLLPILQKTEVKMDEPQLRKSSSKLNLLKQVLSSEFPETYVRQEQAALQAINSEKKLWNKFNSGKPIILPPIHQLKKTKLEARDWDIDTPTQVPAQIKDEEWEELKYCHYLRPPVTKT